MTLENISCQKSAGGWHKRYRHRSAVLGCDMVFAVYLPPQAEQGGKLPVLYWLSGLTCTDENFMQKAGAHKLAAELGLIIVAPDTSPRGPEVPDDPDKAWDFGLGAGFYLNATQEPWARHYRMYDYVVQELPALVDKLDSTLSQLESASKNANGILNENRDSWAEFSQDGLGQVGPTMRQLRGLIREIDDLANKLENNPAGYLLGREEPEEFEP